MDVDKPLMARQPILDAKGVTFAYELLCRSIPMSTEALQSSNGNLATGEILLAAFLDIGIDNITGGLPAFVNMTESWLSMPPAIKSDKLVVEILEYVPPTDANIAAVKALRQQGFRVALDDFTGDEVQRGWLPYVDIVKVDVMDVQAHTSSAELVSSNRNPGLIWLAEKVEAIEDYERLKSEGYQLFQGFFFSRPALLYGERKQDSQYAVLRLINELNNPDNTTRDISTAIQSDPQLSYRILQFINSASVSSVNKVTSIHQAVTMAGVKRILGWANMLALGRLDNKPRALLEQALSRAYICQMLAKHLPPTDDQTAYTVGMFSLLNAFVDEPMAEVCDRLQLSDAMSDALLRGDGIYGEILKVATLMSEGRLEDIRNVPRGIDPGIFAEVQQSAFLEVGNQLRLCGIA